MDNPKVAPFPRPSTTTPLPPGPDLGADAEAAVQSAQTFTAANQNVEGARDERRASGRWRTSLLLIVAAAVGIAFLLAIR